MTHNEDNLLRLNLQYFAEESEGESNEEGAQVSEENTQDSGNSDESNPDGEGGGTDDTVTLTQSQLDKMITDRLARERKKQEEKQEEIKGEEEKKRLEEQQEYKDLADKLQQELDQRKQNEADLRKQNALADAGYTGEQAEILKGTLTGDSEDEIKESVETLKATFPPKKDYVDPSQGNGGREKPEKQDGKDVGKSAFERIKHKI